MGINGFMIFVREFFNTLAYALPMMLMFRVLNCTWMICWWCKPAMVMVAGSLIWNGVSSGAGIAYDKVNVMD